MYQIHARYIHIVTSRSLRPSQYEPDYGENFDRTKFFAVHAAKIYCITLAFLGVLQPLLLNGLLSFSTMITIKTHKYTVLFRDILQHKIIKDLLNRNNNMIFCYLEILTLNVNSHLTSSSIARQ